MGRGQLAVHGEPRLACAFDEIEGSSCRPKTTSSPSATRSASTARPVLPEAEPSLNPLCDMIGRGFRN